MAIYKKPVTSEFKKQMTGVNTEKVDKEKKALKRSLEAKNDEIINLNQEISELKQSESAMKEQLKEALAQAALGKGALDRQDRVY